MQPRTYLNDLPAENPNVFILAGADIFFVATNPTTTLNSLDQNSYHMSQPTEVTSRGRLRRPTVKVQAMLGKVRTSYAHYSTNATLSEVQQDEDRASEKRARDKAKRHETLTRKREQVTKAAEQALTPTTGVDAARVSATNALQQPLAPDDGVYMFFC